MSSTQLNENRAFVVHLEISELVVSSDMSVVSGESHEEVYEGHDHDDGGDRGEDEHDLGSLHKLPAEQVYLQRTLQQQVDPLRAGREEEVEDVEVELTVLSPDLSVGANSPADGVESRHHQVDHQHGQPGHQQHVGENDEEHSGHPPAHPAPVGGVHLQSGVSRGQDGGHQDQHRHGTHHGSRYHEGQLCRLQPSGKYYRRGDGGNIIL